MTTPDTGTAAPELLSRGQYSLYKSPDGGMHLAYRAEGMEEDAHLVMPPALVRMATAAAEGRGPFARLRAMMPGRAEGELDTAERIREQLAGG